MKRVLAIVLAFALLWSMTTSFAAEFKPYIRLITSTTIQEIETGKEGGYKIKLTNVGNYGAQPLTIKLAGEHPFRADSSELVKDIKYVGVRTEHEVEFKVTPSPLAQDRIYEFDVIFTYKDDNEAVHSNTEKAYVKIINKNIEPIMVLSEVTANVYPAPVEVTNSLTLTLKNAGTLNANKVKATLSGLSADGIILYNDAETKVLGTIEAGKTHRFFYIIRPSKKLETGTQTLTLQLEYNDEYGNSYKKDLQVFLPVLHDKEKPKDDVKEDFIDKIKITDIVAPETVLPEQEFDISYVVTNLSSVPVKKMFMAYEHPEGFIAKKNSRTYVDLLPGESKQVTMTMIAKKGIQDGTVHAFITATLGIVGEDKVVTEKVVSKEYVGVYVYAPEKDDKASASNRPKLIVEKYEYGGSAKAGEEFDLVLHIKNTSATQHTKNIKIVLSSSDGIFTPVNTSSSIFVNGIAPGETEKVVMRYKTKMDAAVQIYTVGVKMDYEDGEGKAFDAQNNPYSESENLSIQVVQDAVLSVNDPFINPEIYVGDRYDIDLQFYNEGKAKISNLKVRIEGIAVRENSYYVGNFDPGANDTFSVSLVAEEEGEVFGTFIFEFENPMGEIEKIEKEIQYYIMPAADRPKDNSSVVPGMEDEQPAEENKIDWTLIAMIGGGVLAVILVAVVVVFKKRKRQQSIKELEEMFNEQD